MGKLYRLVLFDSVGFTFYVWPKQNKTERKRIEESWTKHRRDREEFICALCKELRKLNDLIAMIPAVAKITTTITGAQTMPIAIRGVTKRALISSHIMEPQPTTTTCYLSEERKDESNHLYCDNPTVRSLQHNNWALFFYEQRKWPQQRKAATC